MRALRRLTLIAASLVAAAGSPAAAHAAESPTTDPFYSAPGNLRDLPDGAVIRQRSVNVQLGPAPVTGPAVSAYQLLYRTSDATGEPVANVTTVLVPSIPAPTGTRQLVSLADAEDSVDPNCAPSYELQVGDTAEQGNGNLAAEFGLVANQLAAGRDLVIPDAEGPRSEYIVSGMEGHAALDSIRAVEHFAPAGLAGAATPVGMVGYSGGAHVTAAADELAPTYAPELNIVGVAAGGVPVGDQATVNYINGGVGTGVLMAVSIAMDRAYPQLDLQGHLNAAGKAFATKVSTGCASSVFAAPLANFDQWTTQPDLFDLPVVRSTIARNALGHHAPTAPTFFYNGVHDELISVKDLDGLVGRYCAAGTPLEYVRDQAGAEHVQGVANFAPLALAYLSERFAGGPVPSNCSRLRP